MSFSFEKLPGGKWVWIIGGIVVIVAVYVFTNSNSENNGDNTASFYSPAKTPDELASETQIALGAQQIQAGVFAAQSQMAIASLQSNRDIALAEIGADNDKQNAAIVADLQKFVATQSAAVSLADINAQLQAARTQSEFDLASADIASQTTIKLKEQDVSLVSQQLQSNRDMFIASINNQTEQAKINALTLAAVNLPKGRGNRLTELRQAFSSGN